MNDDSTSRPVSFGEASYVAHPVCQGHVAETTTSIRECVRAGPAPTGNTQGIAGTVALNSRRTLPEGTQKATECWSRPCPGGRVSHTWGVKAVATRFTSSVLRDMELN